MFKPLRAHRGSMIFAIVLVLMTLAVIILAVKAGSVITGTGQRLTGTQGMMTRIQQSLVQYVATYGELPCPANPSATNNVAGEPDGVAPTVPPTPVTNCTYPGGVVPWKALGLTVSDVTDPWGRLISYRVFDGPIGLTQAQGASKVDCDTSNIDLAGRQTPEKQPTSSGLCDPDHNTLDTSFTNHWSFSPTPRIDGDKGLVVDDFGTVVRNVAYVLISHGPTGLGGWLPSGTQMSLPNCTAVTNCPADYPNLENLAQGPPPPIQILTYYPTQTPTAFVKAAASDPSVDANAAGFYDDVVAYLKIDDLAHLAKLDARDWPEALQTATDIQNFSVATTSNLTNTATADHFITSINTAQNTAQEFQSTTSSGGVGGGGVYFGSSSGKYSAALWWPNQVQLYSPDSGAAVATSGASWDAGVITFTTAAPHNLEIGDTVTVAGTLPQSYDGTYIVTEILSPTSFTVAQEANPGQPLVTNGKVTKTQGFRRTLIVSVEAAFNSLTGSSDAGGGLVLGFLPTDGYWVNASSPSAISLTPTLAIGNAYWTPNWGSSYITYTTSGTFPFVTGNTVTVTGMPDSGYNGIYSVSGTPSSNSFTVLQGWPGAWSSSGGKVTGTVAGSSFSPSGIGWDNSSGSGSDGNLPAPRFGVEMDMQYNSYRNDPNNENHIAVDGSGVTHGSTAASCSSSSNTYTTTKGCYTGSSDSWLMEGLTHFHRVRVEVEPMSPSCGSTAPLLKYWLLPYGVCSSLNTLATGTSWSGGIITFATLASPNLDLAKGDTVTVTGAFPQGYNGTYTVATAPNSTTFTVVNQAGFTSVVGGTAWSGGAITFVTATNHGLVTGNTVTVTGVVPSGYNGSYTVTGTPTSNTFTVAPSSDPGRWESGGTVAPTVAWVSGGTVAKVLTLATGTSWSSGVIKFVTAASHDFVAGNAVTVTGASPAAYNGTFTVLSTPAPTATTFYAAYPTDPGGPWSGGTVTTAQDCTDIEDASTLYNPQSFPSGGVYLSQCIAPPIAPRNPPDPADAFNNLYFGFTSNNNNNNWTSNFVLQNLNSSLISVP